MYLFILYRFEKSRITLKMDSKFNTLDGDESIAKVMFVKYNTMSEFASGLHDKISSQTGRTFDGRSLNGVFIGAVIRYNGTDMHIVSFKDEVKIEFVHKRLLDVGKFCHNLYFNLRRHHI